MVFGVALDHYGVVGELLCIVCGCFGFFLCCFSGYLRVFSRFGGIFGKLLRCLSISLSNFGESLGFFGLLLGLSREEAGGAGGKLRVDGADFGDLSGSPGTVGVCGGSLRASLGRLGGGQSSLGSSLCIASVGGG